MNAPSAGILIAPDRLLLAEARAEGGAVVASRMARLPWNAHTAESPSFEIEPLRAALAELAGPRPPRRVRVALSDFLLSAQIVQPIRPAKGEPFDRAVAAAARRDGSIDLSGDAWDFRLFRGQELAAFVYRAPGALLDRIVRAFAALGTEVASVAPESAALVRFLAERVDGAARRNLLLVDIGPLRTLVFALESGDPLLHRVIEGGYAHFAPGARALDLLPADLSAADPVSRAARPLDALGAAFRRLTEEIERTVRGMRIQRGTRRFFDALHLSGPLAADPDMRVLIEEICGTPHIADPEVRLDDPALGHEAPGPWLPALAAATAPAGED